MWNEDTTDMCQSHGVACNQLIQLDGGRFDTIILPNPYGRISRVVKAKYCTSAVGTSVMRCLDNE